MTNLFKLRVRQVPSEPTGVRERGQALVEAALAIVILLLLLSGVLDLGRAFFTYLALHNAAGEGAYYASAFPKNVTAAQKPDPNNIHYRTRNESPDGLGKLVNWQSTTVSVQYRDRNGNVVGQPKVGGTVAVKVEFMFEMIGPLPGLFGFPRQIPMVAEAKQTVLTDQ